MPPARRAQQNAATSSTAAGNGQIDPAIISSQIARPETASESKSEKSENPGSKPQPAPVAPPTSATTVSPSTSATAKEVKPVRHAGKAGQTATENVETEVLDSFRQFVNTEKMKVQDQKRSRASADKAVKLNDLMKFSKNFKLLTPVPKDLIPILAKDENKQREIVQKAQRNADTSKPLKPTTIAEQKSQRPLTMARWEGDSAPPTGHQASVSRNQANAGLPKDRQQQTRELAQSARNQNGLSARLTDSHRLHKANMPVSIPNPLPIQAGGSMRGGSNFNKGMPSPQKTPGGRGPPSATSTKFNVQAMEFKPNPTASAFKPGGPVANTVASNTMTTNSPKSTPATRPISPLNPPAKFFSEKPNFGKLETRASPLNGVRPTAPTAPQIQTWAEATVNGGSKVDPTALPASNGYVQYPYRTHPTWVLAEANETEVRYYEAYGSRNLRQTTPPHQASPVNLTAHQHQLPLHLQNGAPNAQLPQVQTPQQIPHQMHPQPHHFPHAPHYDDNHMRPSASTSSVYPAPSPRMQNTNMAYHQSPMPRHASLAYNQPPVQYVMHPGPQMAGRQFSNGGPNMMPGQGAHLAPMMVQAPSAGGFVAQPMAIPYAPQMQMYPGPNMPMYGTPSQPPSNYPSPGQGAPMMVHQGSHQGHQQVMFPAGQFAQPVFQGQPPAHSKL